jgi:hypothetical protein
MTLLAYRQNRANRMLHATVGDSNVFRFSRKAVFLFLLALIAEGNVNAQSEFNYPPIAGFQLLTVAPVTSLTMNSGAYAALPVNDINGLYFNPAQIGHFAATNQVSLSSGGGNWLSSGPINHAHVTLGAGVPIRLGGKSNAAFLGVALTSRLFDFGTDEVTDEEGNSIGVFDNTEQSSGIGFGIHYEGAVGINAGVNYSKQRATGLSTATSSMADIGAQVYVPLTWRNIKFVPSAGFALMNTGKNITFELPLFAGGSNTYVNTPPATARVGLAAAFELNGTLLGKSMVFVAADVSAESREMLAYSQNESLTNRSWPRETKLQNLIDAKQASSLITVHRGFRIRFLEIIRVGLGHYEGEFYENRPSQLGLEISSEGIAKFVKDQNSAMNRVLSRFEFKVSYVQYESLNKNNSNRALDGTRIVGGTISYTLSK